MLAYPLRDSLADLLREVAHGNPVIVFQNLGTRWLPRWHFAVVVGYDLQASKVILRSGTTERWRTTLATFEFEKMAYRLPSLPAQPPIG